MPRKPRLPSESGIYHIMTRGNEQKDIFHEDEDKSFLISILKQKKQDSFNFLAICIMDNHMHLLGKFDPISDLSSFMSKINTSYASYYNKKSVRIGHVFQGRFHSETIQNEQHFLACVRYIHNNPVKAGMVKKPSDYHWSSYMDFISSSGIFHDLIDTESVLSNFSPQHKTAVKAFQKFSGKEEEEVFIDCKEIDATKKKSILTLTQANQYIDDFLHQMKVDISDLHQFEHIKKRNHLIQQLKEKSNLSIRQIAELLKISKGSVINAL